jgi:NADH dehydrogenase (ubiquinone) 1 alpha subcomplex subunit 13
MEPESKESTGLKADICSTSSELAREKMWSRLHLTPLLQAEEDRDQVRRYYADKAREKELLGTDAKIYNSDR